MHRNYIFFARNVHAKTRRRKTKDEKEWDAWLFAVHSERANRDPKRTEIPEPFKRIADYWLDLHAVIIVKTLNSAIKKKD